MAGAETCRCHKLSGYFISALPGGNRNNNGTFNNLGNNGNWWSSTENNTSNAWNRNMNYNNSNVNRNNNKQNGFSVRCVRDLKASPQLFQSFFNFGKVGWGYGKQKTHAGSKIFAWVLFILKRLIVSIYQSNFQF